VIERAKLDRTRIMQVIAKDDSKSIVNRGFKKRGWLWLIGLGTVIVLSGLSWYYFWPRQIASSGGLYFPYPLRLPVPRFAQGDQRWANDSLAGTQGTMAAEGCAVSSAAMVLAFYGLELDPGQLNQFLIDHDGFTAEGWLRWDKAADFTVATPKKVGQDLRSFFRVGGNLLGRNPVISRLRLSGGVCHFVVIVGKRGFHYLL